MDTRFAKFVQEFRGRLAVPLCAYSGLEITGESVEDMVSVPGSQFKAIMAVNDRYQTPVLVTAIDTTVEAEAYGSEVRIPAREAPSVVGRLISSSADIASLADPIPGDARTRVPLETAWRLTAEVGESVPVLGAMLGPFALASRLFGLTEAVAAIPTEPETIETLLDIVTGFLCRYALEFRETGAWGILVAEAAAGNLSPEGVARFSAPFVKRIVKAVETSDFAVILHHGQASPSISIRFSSQARRSSISARRWTWPRPWPASRRRSCWEATWMRTGSSRKALRRPSRTRPASCSRRRGPIRTS